jgi:hypothetical protein
LAPKRDTDRQNLLFRASVVIVVEMVTSSHSCRNNQRQLPNSCGNKKSKTTKISTQANFRHL